MTLKEKVDNHPLYVILAILATLLAVFAGIKTVFNSTATNVYRNSGSGTQNNASRDVNIYQGALPTDPSTPEGAREALQRQGKAFDEEGFGDSIREGDIGQIKLYLIGGKSPNELYGNEAPLLNVAIENQAPHFGQMLDLFLNWKPDPLNLRKINPNISTGANILGIPHTQEAAIFTDLAIRYSPGGGPENSALKAAGDLLVKKGYSPQGVIDAYENTDRELSASVDQAKKNGTEQQQEQDALINHSKTPAEAIAENTQWIEFLKSLGH